MKNSPLQLGAVYLSKRVVERHVNGTVSDCLSLPLSLSLVKRVGKIYLQLFPL